MIRDCSNYTDVMIISDMINEQGFRFIFVTKGFYNMENVN